MYQSPVKALMAQITPVESHTAFQPGIIEMNDHGFLSLNNNQTIDPRCYHWRVQGHHMRWYALVVSEVNTANEWLFDGDTPVSLVSILPHGEIRWRVNPSTVRPIDTWQIHAIVSFGIEPRMADAAATLADTLTEFIRTRG